jgi:hypothetical protein
MTSFTTFVHVTGSARNMGDDLKYLRKIIKTVYANHAMVAREWVEPAHSRTSLDVNDEDVDWATIIDENMTAIARSDLVIVEASQSRFSQGLQAYTAAQYKKPTLIVTRSVIKNRYISGVESKYISVKHYSNEEELELIVSKFIKRNTIAEKNLRFNMILDRRIVKFLRDKSYETGKNKSEIIRELLEQEIERREN